MMMMMPATLRPSALGSSSSSSSSSSRSSSSMATMMMRPQLASRRAHSGGRGARRPIATVVAASALPPGVVAAASVAAVSGVQQQQQQQQQHHHHHHHHHPQPHAAPRSASGQALRDPARLSARGTSTVSVPDAGGDVSLAAYMRLPVEQYYVLDPSQISALPPPQGQGQGTPQDGGQEEGAAAAGTATVGGGRFELRVPRVNLLGTALAPVIEVEVSPREDAVVLRATRCRLRGEGVLAGLDHRCALSFTTVITWATATTDPAKGALTGSASIDVACEVIPPFHLLSRSTLERSCNAVLSGLVSSLLPLFMRQLAADYVRWAAEPDYRAARAARSLAPAAAATTQ